MGLRFRKSIKIARGVRMNIGKRGVGSFSVGNFNFGKRGVYQNFSIPGTGLSYRAKIIGGSKSRSVSRKSTSPQHHRPQKTKEIPVTFRLEDDGSTIFTDKNGKPLPDIVVQTAKKQNREFIIHWLQEQCEKYNAEIESVLNIHLTTPVPVGEIVINPKPDPPKIKTHGLTSKLFGNYRQKVDEQNKRVQKEYEEALLQWEQAEHALRTDTEVMSTILSKAVETIEWPRETLISFDIVGDDRPTTVLLDVDLPEIEDMPTQVANVNKRDLRLTIKERSQTQKQVDYMTHIHAIGFRFIGDVFAHLPSVSIVVVSGYSQRVSKKTGNIEDEYLYSARVPRETWEQINFDNLEVIDVVECFERFDLRRKMTKRGVILPIEPFEE